MPITPLNQHSTPTATARPARMRPPSAKYETRTFEKTLRDRMPLVTHASKRLQAAMGLPANAQLMGDQVVTVWRMPEPPDRALMAKLEVLKAGFFGGAVEPQIEDAGNDADGAQEANNEVSEVEGGLLVPDIVIEPPSEGPALFNHAAVAPALLQKRKRAPSSPRLPKPQQRLARKRSKPEVIDLTESPLLSAFPGQKMLSCRGTMHFSLGASQAVIPASAPAPKPLLVENSDRAATNESAFMQKALFAPASPPPPNYNAGHSDRDKSSPMYWAPSLTHHIREWLQNPQTLSYQVPLARIVFSRNHNFACSPLHVFESKSYEKLKLIRLTLPASAAQGLLEPERSPLYWLVIVCVSMGISGDSFESDNSDSEDEPDEEDELPYWCLGWPISQITEYNIEEEVSGCGIGLSARAVRTTMLLGIQGRVPLLHGRGMDERMFDGFAAACSEGRGVVEVVSLGLLLPEGGV